MMFDTSFIDFDNTLYDTYRFVGDITAILKKCGVSEKDIAETFDVAIQGKSGGYFDYTFDNHLALVHGRGYDFPMDELMSQLSTLLVVPYQYPDAEKFLQNLKERSRHVVLLTAG